MTKIPSVEKVVEQLAQQEWLMIGDVPTSQHWLRKALTTYAKTVAEEAVRVERERVTDILEGMQVREVGTKNSREFRRYKNDVIDYALEALTPLPDKE